MCDAAPNPCLQLKAIVIDKRRLLLLCSNFLLVTYLTSLSVTCLGPWTLRMVESVSGQRHIPFPLRVTENSM
jgi:hypothetical protein|eukprot:COSAG01_NODE_414_length_17360_cov_226.576907_19_plen_72_part_00